MTLSIHDLLRLSRIGEDLRRSHPELSGSFGRANRRPTWRAVSHGLLCVCTLLGLVGLVVGSITASIVGGALLMIAYPVLLLLAQKERRKRWRPRG
jgi:Protein of unknown function (DUF3040)